MGDLLLDSGRRAPGIDHLKLAVSVRQDNGWKVPPELSASLHLAGIRDDNGSENMQELLKKCADFWKKERYRNQPRARGKVKTILPNGKAGFIAASDRDYYFRTSAFCGDLNAIVPGLQVEFIVTKGFDAKKNMESLQAVEIKPVRGEEKDGSTANASKARCFP